MSFDLERLREMIRDERMKLQHKHQLDLDAADVIEVVAKWLMEESPIKMVLADVLARVGGDEYCAGLRTVEMLKNDIYEIVRMEEERARTGGKILALRYIDGWISSKFATYPTMLPAARAILDDMRVHVIAAIARLERGDGMEATTSINAD